jgi:hypothetical protein
LKNCHHAYGSIGNDLEGFDGEVYVGKLLFDFEFLLGFFFLQTCYFLENKRI